MTNINFDANFWAQTDGTYTGYTISGNTCTLTSNIVVSVTDGSIPIGKTLETNGYDLEIYNELQVITFTNKGTINNDTNIWNYENFINNGTLTSGSSSKFYNAKYFINNGTFTTEYDFTNYGVCINNGTFTCNQGNANFNNHSYLINNDSITTRTDLPNIYNYHTILSNSVISGEGANNLTDDSGRTGVDYEPDTNGNINITADFTLPDSSTFEVPDGKTLKISNGVTFTI